MRILFTAFCCFALLLSLTGLAHATPGDLIFTGTSGSTKAMKPGDVVEVEISGIGVLRNPVIAE